MPETSMDYTALKLYTAWSNNRMIYVGAVDDKQAEYIAEQSFAAFFKDKYPIEITYMGCYVRTIKID